MKYITRKEIRSAIENYLPVGVEMANTTSIYIWLAENVFDYSPWLRHDYCKIVIATLEKENFFTVTRSATNLKIYVRK